MRKLLTRVFTAGLGLLILATPAAAGLFSAKGAVIAIVANELFVGEAEGHLGGAGTLVIRSQKNPRLRCLGDFISSAELGGSGQMQCNDGSSATFRFDRLSLFHGHGSGKFSRGPMTFVYGIPAAEAGRYLSLPVGKKLEHNGTELVLADI